MRAQRIVMAGGGVGGLTAALALAQRGHEVEVLEQAPALSATAGAGVTLAPNAMRVYDRLGVGDALCAAGVQPDRQRVQHWRDGRVLHALERGTRMMDVYGARYLYIHRGDLHSVLVAALEATGRVAVRLDAAVTGAEARGEVAAAHLADGSEAEGDAVIGADGVKSAVRSAFEPAAPHFTGHVAWRGLVPIDTPVLCELTDYPGIHIGPGRMVVRYPVRPAGPLNLVFYARQDGWAEEGWAIPGRRAELEALFAGWAPEVDAMVAAVDEARLFKWGVFARSPLETWVRGGRVALLGDAAHAMTPFLGQGASTAIEDAAVLSRALDAAADMPEALARYQHARMRRCAFIQAESNANADRMQGDETQLFGLTEVKNEETLGLFGYDADAATV